MRKFEAIAILLVDRLNLQLNSSTKQLIVVEFGKKRPQRETSLQP